MKTVGGRARVRVHNPPEVRIGETAHMTLARNPFVASSCDDFNEGRTHRVAVRALLDEAPSNDLDLHQEHQATPTFMLLWNNLPASGQTRSRLLAVMRGISIEPRHPAYRVEGTDLNKVHRAQVGDAYLVFHRDGDDICWLAVLHDPEQP